MAIPEQELGTKEDHLPTEQRPVHETLQHDIRGSNLDLQGRKGNLTAVRDEGILEDHTIVWFVVLLIPL